MATHTHAVTFPAADGGPLLEGILYLPDGAAPFPAAVVCHPHPQMGGSMRNALVVEVCRSLALAGWVALRFNFRGTGRSKGSFDDGRGEMEDVAGAVDLLRSRPEVDGGALAVAGYSFGAVVGMRHAARNPRVGWLVAVALPQEVYGDSFLDGDARPKLFVAGDRDRWAPAEPLRAYVERLREPSALELIPGTDHFFGGRARQVAERIVGWLQVDRRSATG
jgi:alpha/beta superfamily hydrolase